MLPSAPQRALRRGAQKSTVVMMRHGELTWNLENKFTGEDAARAKRSFSGLESDTPSASGSEPSRRASRRESAAFHAGWSAAPSRRKVMKKQRRPADSSPPKGSNSM